MNIAVSLNSAPDELTCWVVMRRGPPLPFLPSAWHGREILVLAMCYSGDINAGKHATAELRSLGSPIVDVVEPRPFTSWQAMFDPLLTPGARNYWKTHDFTELSDGAISVLTQAIRELPGSECEIFIGHVGGVAGRVALEATAFPQRNAHFVMNVHARWREPKMDQACIDWAKNSSALPRRTPQARPTSISCPPMRPTGWRRPMVQTIADWRKSSAAMIRPTCSA